VSLRGLIHGRHCLCGRLYSWSFSLGGVFEYEYLLPLGKLYQRGRQRDLVLLPFFPHTKTGQWRSYGSRHRVDTPFQTLLAMSMYRLLVFSTVPLSKTVCHNGHARPVLAFCRIFWPTTSRLAYDEHGDRAKTLWLSHYEKIANHFCRGSNG